MDKDDKTKRLEALIGDMDMAKKAYLVSLYHKAGYKHEDYLETDNKRPGPPMDITLAEKEELQDREDFASIERRKNGLC